MKIRFGPFTLDLDTRQLIEGTHDIHLTPKAFDLLSVLIAERPRVLSKAVLQQRLWPDTFVAEANLSNLIAEVREALNDSARTPLFIRTSHGFGYAFCGEVTAPDAAGTDAGRPPCWLEWGNKRFPLSAGQHVIGRDEDVEIRLDSSTVSRRHARLLVAAERTVLEDFGSKNGTYRDDERVTAPVQLADGDTIRIGSLVLTFRARGAAASTDTHSPSSR